jgi:hypothetical protein
MDSERWRQERQPGEARGGSHSPQVRTIKVSGGPNSSLVAYQDSRTHAARQHWGPSKPYDGAAHTAADAYDQPRQSTSSRPATTTYPSPGGYSDPHYTTTPTPAYGTSHPGYPQASPASAAPRTQPADPYSAYQQPGGRDYPAQSPYSSYPQTTDAYGRPTANPSAPYAATPRYFGYYDEPFLVYR